MNNFKFKSKGKSHAEQVYDAFEPGGEHYDPEFHAALKVFENPAGRNREKCFGSDFMYGDDTVYWDDMGRPYGPGDFVPHYSRPKQTTIPWAWIIFGIFMILKLIS